MGVDECVEGKSTAIVVSALPYITLVHKQGT
jgi:hypothetical protein